MLLYISNRAEIARRIIRSAKKLGFRTAVGYPPCDKDLAFVREADVSKRLEVENSRDAYLNIELVIQTAKELGATHLHPGYGFLSERSEFVRAVEAAGIEFVGPHADAMDTLGDKIGSRNFLKKLEIPLLPSYEGEDQNAKRLEREAETIGFPLLIKPSAGGGGKGMMKVSSAEEFASALESSQRVAQASFGDARVFLEAYVEAARHVEVQILGDKHGNCLSIGERECSVQRRHQKLIEECPCIFLSPRLRESLLNHSRRIAEELGYHSLGTVEWLWDGKDQIYFLEVNTRLQVEHPVTELVYGLDLVELQLRVALGENLGHLQVRANGHAIEARICAEDPQQNFMPSGGKIHRMILDPQVRNDFGYDEGNTVGADFDSMLGKSISFGQDRVEALTKIIDGLQNTCIFGPTTNRAYLLHILEGDRFQKGDLSTQMLDKMRYQFPIEKAAKLLSQPVSSSPSMDGEEEDRDLYSPWGAFVPSAGQSFFWENHEGYRYFHADFADWKQKLDKTRAKEHLASEAEGSDFERVIRSPMPGKVVQVLRKTGEELKKNDLILVMEAMKMEHKILASHPARVKALNLKPGQQVLPDEILVELEDL